MKENNKEIKERLLKARTLSDEELEQVTGGWSQNADGTYNFYRGDTLRRGNHEYTVEETKLNATLKTKILCEYYILDGTGKLLDYGEEKYDVEQLLPRKL